MHCGSCCTAGVCGWPGQQLHPSIGSGNAGSHPPMPAGKGVKRKEAGWVSAVGGAPHAVLAPACYCTMQGGQADMLQVCTAAKLHNQPPKPDALRKALAMECAVWHWPGSPLSISERPPPSISCGREQAGQQSWELRCARRSSRQGRAAGRTAAAAARQCRQRRCTATLKTSALTSCSCTRAPLSWRICAMWAPPLPRTAPTCAQAERGAAMQHVRQGSRAANLTYHTCRTRPSTKPSVEAWCRCLPSPCPPVHCSGCTCKCTWAAASRRMAASSQGAACSRPWAGTSLAARGSAACWAAGCLQAARWERIANA